MISGMRHVIGGAALAAGILLQAAPAFAQAPPWAQQQRRYAPQPHQRAPQAAPAHQTRPPQAPQAAQPKAKPEPVVNVAERASCLNTGTPQAALIEACTVLAITSVVVGTTVPGMQGLIETRRLNGAAALLATDIQYVRTEAVTRNRALRLSVHPSGDGSCYVIHTGAAAQARRSQLVAASGEGKCAASAPTLLGSRESARRAGWRLEAGDDRRFEARIPQYVFQNELHRLVILDDEDHGQ